MHLKIVASSLLCFSYAVNSVSITFTNNSPWTEGIISRSEGECSLSLDRTYAAKEWIIAITVDNPTMQIGIWNYYVKGPINNTYYLENKYIQTAGPKLLTFHLDTSTYQPLTGFCISNADRLSTNPADHSTVSLNTEYIEDHTSSAMYGGSTTDNLYCFEPNMICRCFTLLNITATSVKQSVANLKRDLRIDKKNTLLARSKKISATDNRPSAKAIGSIGVLVLCISLGAIVLSDVKTLYNSVKSIKFVTKYGKRRKKRNDNTDKTQINPSEDKCSISDSATNLIKNDSMWTSVKSVQV
ncbi:uncharacterized protein LOC134726801 [Mytilus trossulus]|uniref:uncharacterized protein LOC134726801 n=1 Tax=Mytilus trossulus TaxID=6551 RepID=UPI003003D989